MTTPNRYLKKVQIRNFQSHRDTEVNLVPGINLVVGSNDVGKSAFMRAINLAMHNEVPNREFVTYGAQNATVILEFSDGTVVERIKGETKNAYNLTLPDGSVYPFDKIGNKTPDDVIKALGYPPIDKRHGPIAYADQHSPLFLVSLTPTELPRAISELTGLDDYEEASMNLAKKTRQYDKQIRDSKERIANIEAELEGYSGLDDEIARQEVLQAQVIYADTLYANIASGAAHLDHYREIIQQGKEALAELNHAKQVLVLQESIEYCGNLQSEIEQAADALELHEAASAEIQQLQNSLKCAQDIINSPIQQLIDDCAGIQQQIQGMECTMNAHQAILADGKQTKAELERTIQLEHDSLLAYDTLMRELSASGMICSKCNQLVGGVQ